MLVAALLFAHAAVKHTQAPQSQFIATTTPELVPQFTTELHDQSLLVQDWPVVEPTSTPTPIPTPTPTPIPTLSPPKSTNVRAAAAAETHSLVPWYVPAEWRDRYLACLSSPGRYGVSEWVWKYSSQGGMVPGWDYNQAMYVVSKEGGDDICQFNSQGSGACGPFQTLYCAGLTPEEHYSAAYAKWLDGYRRNPGDPFRAHWFAFWNP